MAVTQLRMDEVPGGEDLQPCSIAGGMRTFLNEATFRQMIAVERKRTERTKKPFVLMLVEATQRGTGDAGRVLDRVMTTLQTMTRETDVIGWYKECNAIGVMFTGLTLDERDSTLGGILSRVGTALRDELTFNQFSEISISFHFFPDEWKHDGNGETDNSALYPDLCTAGDKKRMMQHLKRAVDIVGSVSLLALCMPLLAVIAVAIKATSKGSILFKQQRAGQHGRSFTFLKFRTMCINNDHTLHREYMTRLIAGSAERIPLNGNGDAVFKLVNDQRITPVGKLLRRTSLDELPQLINVLRGEMSLVGPRPPIPYELAAYQTWHRRRLLQVKPGITGLWQVNGRSRVTFDEMVRMDLRYATMWSPWLDFKILLRTPSAVIKGAY